MSPGLTLPNRQWDDFTAAEARALIDLQPHTLVVLIYDLAQEATLNHRAVVRSYVEKNPRTRVIYRPYADDIPQRSLDQWLAECWKRVGFYGLGGEVVLANELNLVSEQGFGEDWDRHVHYLRAIATLWRTVSALPLHLPALSPTGAYRDGYRVFRDAGLFGLFDIVDVHVYAEDQLRWVEEFSQEKPGLFSITEFNQIETTLLLDRAEAAGLRDAVYFLLGGTPDQQQYDILDLPAVYGQFKAWTILHEEAAMSQDERDRYYADLYKRFGVPLNPDSAIYQFWRTAANGGTWYGPPLESEHPTENGQYVYQAFASQVLTYARATGAVTVGLPPFA